MTWFFRDPSRSIQLDGSLIYAAADGVIKEISKTGNKTKIAIRMSPFDVHLNRSPSHGKIFKVQHKPGKHNTVYFAGAEEKNEQNLIVIDSKELEIEILQITGAFARRIECWVREGQSIEQGEKIGMIRFGSQTNMLITPKEKTNLQVVPTVVINQTVRAGLVPIARIERLNHE